MGDDLCQSEKHEVHLSVASLCLVTSMQSTPMGRLLTCVSYAQLNAQMTADIIVQRLEQSLPYTILPEIRVLSAKYEVTTGKVHFHGDGSTPRVLMHALCSIDEQDSGASSAEEDPVAVGTVRSRAQAVHGRQLTSAVPLVAIPLAAVAAAGYLLFCNKT